jgi:hypothetical protein
LEYGSYVSSVEEDEKEEPGEDLISTTSLFLFFLRYFWYSLIAKNTMAAVKRII